MTETGSRVAGVTEEWLATAVVRESAEAIVVTDPAGIIRLWNDGAARMFGFSADEAMGQSLDVIIPEKLAGAALEGLLPDDGHRIHPLRRQAP